MKKFIYSLLKSLGVLFCSYLFMSIPAIAAEFTIPASRITTWEGNVGVNGGIPTNYTKYGSTIETASQSDDTSAIQAALNAASTSQYIELGSGTFTISSAISIPSGKVLRGQGMGATTLDCNIGSTGENGCVNIYGTITYRPASSTTPTWTAGYIKGTSTVTLSSTSGITTGDTLFLDVTNDESSLVFRCGNSCSTYTRDSGTRGLMQATVVTGVTGNNVDISPALYYTFPSGQSPSAYATTTAIENAGLENLTIDGAGNSQNYNVKIGAGNNVWIKGVESNISKRAHFSVRNCSRFQIEKCYYHHSQAYASVSYGIELGDSASAGLIENNIGVHLVTPFVSYGPISGNVIGYNYFEDCPYTSQTTWLTPGVGYHGVHAFMNLAEGNIGWGVSGDNYWGSSSHNTAFRNRLYGYETGRPYNAWSTQNKQHSYYYNIVGNILGTDSYHTQYEFNTSGTCSPQGGIYESGSAGNCALGTTNDATVKSTMLRHANYDYVNDATVDCDDSGEPGCQSATNYNYPTDTLPDSLYLSSKPSFLGSLTWPTIDPSGPTINDNAAKYAYDHQDGNGIPIWPDDSYVAASGSVASGATVESDLVNGGSTLVFTISNDTLVADIDAYRQELIDGCVSAVSAITLPSGWNAEILADESTSAVVRTDSTHITWTLTANTAYSIDQNDGPITCYIPNEMLTTATSDVTVNNTFTISNENPPPAGGGAKVAPHYYHSNN